MPTDDVRHVTSEPLVTYAQNREDLYLWAMLGHRTGGVYVDVGCNHERLHSVSRLFHDRGWRGLSIDANPGFAHEYEARTDRHTFVAAGVAAQPGELAFRIYPSHDGLSTFDADLQQRLAEQGVSHEEALVPVRTLDDLLAEHTVTSIDFLKIDVEGLEPDVLSGLDLAVHRPSVVVFEAGRAAECVDLLIAARFHAEFFDGLNLYYVDDDATDITIHNYAERVLRAGFRTDHEAALEAELASMLREQAARESVVGLRARAASLARQAGSVPLRAARYARRTAARVLRPDRAPGRPIGTLAEG